jgi:hypothetical protein
MAQNLKNQVHSTHKFLFILLGALPKVVSIKTPEPLKSPEPTSPSETDRDSLKSEDMDSSSSFEKKVMMKPPVFVNQDKVDNVLRQKRVSNAKNNSPLLVGDYVIIRHHFTFLFRCSEK